MISKTEIESALKTVIDPELGYDIISLGLVYKIDIEVDRISIVMTLTSPGCPLAPYFVTQVTDAVSTAANIPSENVSLEITFDPPWSPEAMSDDMRLALGL